jgi:hypothetical protein
MPRRAPRRTNGSRGILTPALADRITNLVAHGNYIATAAQACGVGERTIYDWISKGEEAAQALAKGEPVAPRAHLYVRFAQGLADARARAETDAVEVVEQVMRGGHLLEEAPIVTPDGRLARDDQGEILYRRKYAPPDGKLALAYLGAAFPLRWRPNVQRLEVTGADGAPVQVEATARADDLATRLQEHVARRQLELQSGDVVEGEIVDRESA